MNTDELKRYTNIKRGKKAKKGKRFAIRGTAGQGQRQTKVKGRTQAIIDMLRQKKITGEDRIALQDALINKGIKAPNTDVDFYSSILKMTYQNIKININDMLNGRRFNYYYYSKLDYTLRGSVFTNDKLYWLARLCKIIPQDTLNLLIISNMSLSLQTRVRTIDSNIQKGYVQDLSKNFCFIGKKRMERFKASDIAKAAMADNFDKFKEVCPGFVDGVWNKIEFTYNSITYKGFFFSEGVTLCYDSSINENTLTEYIQNVNVYENKTDYKSGFKILTINGDTNIFMSQKVKLVDFVPGSVVLYNNLQYIYSIESEYDIAALDDFLRKRVLDKKENLDDYFLNDLIQWDTLDIFVNYLSILYHSTFLQMEDKTFFEKAGKFIEGYNTEKDFYIYFKKFIGMFTSFCMKFFDSFYNKINIDVCKSLLKQYNNKIQGTFSDINDNKDTIEKLAKLFEECGLTKTCRICYNCCVKLDEVARILSNIVSVLEQIDNGIATNLEINLRSVGVSIFEIMRCSTAENYLINEIRTPYIYLGNLIGNDVDYTKRIIESYVSKTIKTEYDKSAQLDIIKRYMSSDKNLVFKLGIANILNTEGINVLNFKERKYTPTFDKWYTEFIKENSPDKTDDETLGIVILGANAMEAKELPKPKDYDIKEATRKKIYDAYLNYLDKTGATKKLFDADIDKTISWLKEVKDRLKGIDLSYLGEIKFTEMGEAETRDTDPKKNKLLESMTKANTDNKYFEVDEQITLEKLKKLGIPTISELSGGKLSDDDRSAVPWRKLGVADPIMFAFYKRFDRLPRVGKDFYYVDQLRKLTQDYFGPKLVEGLRPKI